MAQSIETINGIEGRWSPCDKCVNRHGTCNHRIWIPQQLPPDPGSGPLTRTGKAASDSAGSCATAPSPHALAAKKAGASTTASGPIGSELHASSASAASTVSGSATPAESRPLASVDYGSPASGAGGSHAGASSTSRSSTNSRRDDVGIQAHEQALDAWLKQPVDLPMKVVEESSTDKPDFDVRLILLKHGLSDTPRHAVRLMPPQYAGLVVDGNTLASTGMEKDDIIVIGWWDDTVPTKTCATVSVSGRGTTWVQIDTETGSLL